MVSARDVALREVREGVRVLIGAWAIGAGLYLLQRLTFRGLLAMQDASGYLAVHHTVIALVSRVFMVAFLGVAIAKVAGSAKLARLPAPQAAGGLPDPYRGAPAHEPVAPAARSLGRLVLGLFAASCTVGLASQLAFELMAESAPAPGAGWLDVRSGLWLAWLCVGLSAELALAAWAARAGRVLGAARPAALAVGLGCLAVIQRAVSAWQVIAQARPMGEVQRALMDLGELAADLGFVLLLVLVYRALEAAERASTSAPDEEVRAQAHARRLARPDAAAWLEVAGALRGYAAAFKGRVALMVVGPPLLVMGRLVLGEEVAEALPLVFPLLGGLIGVAMVVSLGRLLRIPPGPGDDGPALLGVILVFLASLADFYVFSLVQQTVVDRAFAAEDARESLPYAELASQVLSLAAVLTLLSLFQSIARRVRDEALAGRCRSTAALVGAVAIVTMGLRALMVGRVVLGESLLLLALALLIGAVVAAVRYLGVIRDLQAAIVRHAEGAPDEERAVAAV